MDSEAIEDSIDDVNWSGRCRWTENSIVYKRRTHKKALKTGSNNDTATAKTFTKVSSPAATEASTATPRNDVALAAEGADSCRQKQSSPDNSVDKYAELQILEDSRLANNNGAQNLEKPSPSHDGPQNLRGSSPDGQQEPVGNEARNDVQLVSVSPQVPGGNGSLNVDGTVEPLVISKVDDRVRLKFAKATEKDEVQELRGKLESELDQVSRLVEELEAKRLQLASYNSQTRISSNLSNTSNYFGTEGGNVGGLSYPLPQHARTDMVDRRVLVRVNGGMGVVGHQEIRPTVLGRVNSDMGAARLESRPFSRQLSVSVTENNHRIGEYVEKEKRTPKANQYYRNSEFLLGKDRLPSESVKRLKTNNGRKRSVETENAFRFGFGFHKSKNRVFKSCSSLLQRLMKHKHGWVFNEPVDAKALGLVDYHDVIKHPMDLGTIKTRLSQNRYKSPLEFAEDVRLVFRNAMTYNPKGQDVHVMAEQLSEIFEERWANMESEYYPYSNYQQVYQDTGLPTPTSRKARPQYMPGLTPVATQMRTLDRSETMTTSVTVDPKGQRPHVGRTPVPKKPKAKDLDKRPMTYDEKQRLSTNLQNMPSEKLDAIVQIIKKRSSALSQNDDEIEVEIDNVDTETLWELDRFVMNYKKSLSKNKRKAELALQAKEANQTVALMNTATAVADVRMTNGTAFEKKTAPPGVDGQNQGYNDRSSSSSSSSSDSGSSSSDSDSDSSSANGSDADAGHAPGT